jgi:hypothetical protein
MGASVLTPTQLVGTGALTTIGGAVAAGKKRRVDLRACNINGAAADTLVDVYLKDNNTPANSGYRCRNFYLPYGQAGSAPDLEYGLVLTAGMELQVRCGDANSAAFSLTGVEDDA